MRVTSAILFVVGVSLRAQELVQPENATLVFEVATVKSFIMPPPGEPRTVGAPASPNRASYVGRTLKMLISEAWGVKTYQVTGPAWLDSERYEVTAVLPEGKTREQAKFMLQNLLAERFGLKMHRETKEMAVYALAAGKSGPTLKESRLSPPMTDQTTPVNPSAPPRDKDGFLVLPEGRPAFAVTTGPNGNLQMASRMQTMDDFAAHLADFAAFLGIAEKPVLDKTGLTGRYDINIEFSATNRFLTNRAAEGVPAPGGLVPAADPDSVHALATTLERLGLKLESAKAQITIFTVDQANKTPQPN
jgi:uncharacterized protein (TIGR03435 family)